MADQCSLSGPMGQPGIYGRPKAAKLSLTGLQGQSYEYCWPKGPVKYRKTIGSAAADGICISHLNTNSYIPQIKDSGSV